MERVAVLTSGGDSPGMNAAIRAVVRTAVAHGLAVDGIYHGFTGLIAGDFRPLGPRDVGGVLHQGGTMLGTTRCEALKSEKGCESALRFLSTRNIAALIIIGGNGSQTGAFQEHEDRLGFELRVTKLGHIQRGGSPGVFDRMLGTLLGAAAVDAAIERRFGTVVGMCNGQPTLIPLEQVAGRTKPADVRLLDLARVLSL
jgi:6-phosphofructokinase